MDLIVVKKNYKFDIFLNPVKGDSGIWPAILTYSTSDSLDHCKNLDEFLSGINGNDLYCSYLTHRPGSDLIIHQFPNNSSS